MCVPSLGLATNNEAITGAVGTGKSAQTTTVLATVLFTALSGVVFCEVRAPQRLDPGPGLHWATNGLAVLASSAVWAWAIARLQATEPPRRATSLTAPVPWPGITTG